MTSPPPNLSQSSTTSSAPAALPAEDVQIFGCDTWPLHYACRIGNLEHVQFLVDVRHYSVNQMDAHDASPLYLAALCGHNAICQFLLERGAKCDPNGDAARVFYVALTPELRNLLREWSLTAASRDPFLESMSKTFYDGLHADCAATVGGVKIKLHCIILQIRCPKLMDLVVKREVADLSELVLGSEHANDKIMLKIFEYLYTGVFEARELEVSLSAIDLAHHYGLDDLRLELQKAVDKNDDPYRFRCDIELIKQLRGDMRRLAEVVSTPHAEIESLAALAQLVEQADTTLKCHDCTWSLNKFRLASSEYLERALSGGFLEAQSSLLDLSHMIESTDALQYAIQWMYCDEFLNTPSVDTAIEIVELGLVLICPRLSAYTATSVLVPAVNTDNAMGLLQLARAHDFERLEEKCVEEIGASFDCFSNRPELLAALQDEAMNIRQGGDERVIDVPLAAEIRRAIKNRFEEEDNKRADYLVRVQQLLDRV